jgi:mRNA interferase MazF
MERFVKGDVVVLSYPTFDQTSSKKRPACVITVTPRGIIACPITSKKQDGYGPLKIQDTDFSTKSLKQESYVLCSWLASFQFTSVLYKVGSLNRQKTAEIITNVLDILKK